MGITKIEASGYVYNLNDVKDFSGTYSRAKAGVPFVGGAAQLVVLPGAEGGIQESIIPGG